MTTTKTVHRKVVIAQLPFLAIAFASPLTLSRCSCHHDHFFCWRIQTDKWLEPACVQGLPGEWHGEFTGSSARNGTQWGDQTRFSWEFVALFFFSFSAHSSKVSHCPSNVAVATCQEWSWMALRAPLASCKSDKKHGNGSKNGIVTWHWHWHCPPPLAHATPHAPKRRQSKLPRAS
ncbi:hypothetical protein BC940DRAFT_309648 [Gongronella butleri]|nr:hypothetical protein BC940DRAFT_309648 [Gongronella butleri]